MRANNDFLGATSESTERKRYDINESIDEGLINEDHKEER